MGPDDWRLRRQLARRPDGGEQVEVPAPCLRRFARTGILPVGCPCVPRWSRGKAMEMSHSGLVRLPAKEVGVEAPREFESPHLRRTDEPRCAAACRGLVVPGTPVAAAPAAPQWLNDPRESGRDRAFASGRSGCLRVFMRRSGIA